MKRQHLIIATALVMLSGAAQAGGIFSYFKPRPPAQAGSNPVAAPTTVAPKPVTPPPANPPTMRQDLQVFVPAKHCAHGPFPHELHFEQVRAGSVRYPSPHQ